MNEEKLEQREGSGPRAKCSRLKGFRKTIMLVSIVVLLLMRYLIPAGYEIWVARRSHEYKKKPNIIFILTDDQDLHMQSIDYMPKVQQYFKHEGTFFSKHYCTVSLCCPSRVSLLTGRAAHNTNVTDVSEPYGGYSKFVREGLNSDYLPVWLQKAGYNTFYTGKLMNGHSTTTWNSPFPNGWNGSNFLIDPGTYRYLHSITQRNRLPPQRNNGHYSTDIIAKDAIGFLNDALETHDPFFLGVAPIAPHSETIFGKDGVAFRAPIPAKRHQRMFADLQIPRAPNFNPDVSSGGGFIKTLDKANDTVVQYNDGFYRARIQALQAVDDLVENIMFWLHVHPEIAENTYLIYTTDNGYHIGQHRLPPGKTCNIEEDINVPFFIRGPGVAKNKTISYATSHTDIVPTLFELAGIALHENFDGEPMPVSAEMDKRIARSSEHINVEFWGTGLFEGIYSPKGDGLRPSADLIDVHGPNNTYKTVRVISDKYDISYTVWCSNEHELYNMAADPYQMDNLYHQNATMFGHAITKLVPRVDALLLTLKACQGKVCTRPWETLHPDGDVKSLEQAMAPEFDTFYMGLQSKVTFTACANGYLPWLEGALEPLPYRGGNWRRGGWQDLT